MIIDNHYKRCVLYFMFSSGETASSASEKINQVLGEDTVSVRTAQKWFKRFKNGENDVNDRPRSGRPVLFSIDALKNLLEAEPKISVNEIAQRLSSSHATVFRYLKELRLAKIEKSCNSKNE